MGSIDFGSQILSIDYKADADSQVVNGINFGILSPGIYEGGILTRNSDTEVSLSPLICEISDPDSDVLVRIETTENVIITDATILSNPYIVLRFTWANAENNFMDVLSVEYSADPDETDPDKILPNDLIVGRCQFSGSTMLTSFDYTRRSFPYNLEFKRVNFPQTIERDKRAAFLRVFATEPVSNQVYVESGVINSSKGNLLVSGGNYPAGGISSTTSNGRHDIVYIDVNGAVQIEEGTPGASPSAPPYLNRKVIAEIRRGAGRSTIRGSEIVWVNTGREGSVITSDLSIDDTGGRYTADNVEDALQEIAGVGRTTQTVKDNYDRIISNDGDISTLTTNLGTLTTNFNNHAAANITSSNTVHGIRQGTGNGFDADMIDGQHLTDLDSKYLQASNNLSDLTDIPAALTTLGLDNVDNVSQATLDARYLLEANNLSDLDDASIARTNLGLGTAATLVSVTTINGTSHSEIPTEGAVKTYVDSHINNNITASNTVHNIILVNSI